MAGLLVIDREFVRQLLAHEGVQLDTVSVATDHESPRAALTPVLAGDQLLGRMNEYLRRWFGPDGVDALLIRALDRTRREHPALAKVKPRERGTLSLSSVAHDDPAAWPSAVADAVVIEAVIALITTVFALIARLVGDDMTLRLVAQIWPEMTAKLPPANNGSNDERLDR